MQKHLNFERSLHRGMVTALSFGSHRPGPAIRREPAISVRRAL